MPRIKRSKERRRHRTRRSEDFFIANTSILICPYTYSQIINLMDTIVVPVAHVTFHLEDKSEPDSVDTIELRKALNLLESMTDSFKPCYCPPKTCPRMNEHPWRHFLIWLISKIS